MKETSVDIGKVYALRSETGGEVTDENGKLLETLEPNVQLRTMAQEPKWLVPDDCKVTKGNFKRALAALFLLGEGKNILPAGYTRLEYLETSVGDDHINTGIIPGGKILSAEVDACILESGKAEAFLLGSVRSIGYNEFRIGLFQGLNRVKLNSAAAYGSAFDTSRKIYYINRPQGSGVGAEVLLSAEPVAIAETNGMPVYIFRSNTINSPNGINSNDTSRKRIYGCRIWDGEKMVGDYIPARDETGAPCMFDTVTRKAFYNDGTGDFIYPTTTSTYSLRRVLPDLGKLTEHGLRRLYHTPANYEGELYDYALEHGYKPIVETEKPDEGYWVPVWHDREDSIELEWVETEPPAEDELLTIEA